MKKALFAQTARVQWISLSLNWAKMCLVTAGNRLITETALRYDSVGF